MSEWRGGGGFRGYNPHARMHPMHPMQYSAMPTQGVVEVVPPSTVQYYKTIAVPTPKIPLMPGIMLENLEKGGCAWIEGNQIGRREEESTLIQPSHKRHDTVAEGRDPGEVFGVRTLDVDYESTDLNEVIKQILSSLSHDGVTGAQGIRMLDVLKERGSEPTTELLNRILILCKAQGAADDARTAFTCHNGKVLANIQTYRTLSDIARLCGCVQTVLLVLTGIKESELEEKDPKIITNLLAALLAPDSLVRTTVSKDVSGAVLMEVLNKYLKLNLTPLPVDQMQSATLWLATLGRKLEAISFYESYCHSDDITFTVSTYDKLLEAAEEVNVSVISKILSKMKDSNLTPNRQRQLKLLHALYSQPSLIHETRSIYKLLTDSVPQKDIEPEVSALYIAAEGLSKSSSSSCVDAENKSEVLDELWLALQRRLGSTLRDTIDVKILTNVLIGLTCNCLRDKNSYAGISSLLSLASQSDLIDCKSTQPLNELINRLSSGYVTPQTRTDLQDWKHSSLLAVFRDRNIDEWAFKLLCKDLQGGDAAFGFWHRYTAGIFSATEEKSTDDNSNKDGDDSGSNSSDPDAALLKLLEGDSNNEDEETTSTFSLFTPLLASELLGGAMYLVVLDHSACVSIFTDPVKRARFSKLSKNTSTSTVKCAVSFPTLLSLRCSHEDVLVEILRVFVSAAPGTPNIIPLPLSLVYDVATNPYRVRPRKRKTLSASAITSEPPPSLSTPTDILIATLYRFQGIGVECMFFFYNIFFFLQWILFVL